MRKVNCIKRRGYDSGCCYRRKEILLNRSDINLGGIRMYSQEYVRTKKERKNNDDRIQRKSRHATWGGMFMIKPTLCLVRQAKSINGEWREENMKRLPHRDVRSDTPFNSITMNSIMNSITCYRPFSGEKSYIARNLCSANVHFQLLPFILFKQHPSINIDYLHSYDT